MPSIQKIISHAEEQCRNRGSRLTEKRKQGLSGLIESGKALSAYELIDYCREQYGEAIPAMSVYRILDFLQGEQLVHKLDIANKYVACSHITCGHDHGVPQFLICSACGQVEEVTIDRSLINKLKKNVEAVKFELLSTQIELNCLCGSCAA